LYSAYSVHAGNQCVIQFPQPNKYEVSPDPAAGSVCAPNKSQPLLLSRFSTTKVFSPRLVELDISPRTCIQHFYVFPTTSQPLPTTTTNMCRQISDGCVSRGCGHYIVSDDVLSWRQKAHRRQQQTAVVAIADCQSPHCRLSSCHGQHCRAPSCRCNQVSLDLFRCPNVHIPSPSPSQTLSSPLVRFVCCRSRRSRKEL
jgi:hypothetical protein